LQQFSKEQEARLLDLLGQAAELAEHVLELAKEQSEMLASDDLDAFNASLDRGSESIIQINGLHQESELLMQSYASFSNSPEGGKIAAIDKAAARFVETLEQCSQLNTRNLNEAKARTEEFIRQIGSLSLKRKSIGLYAQNTGSSSALFDRKT